MRWRFRISVALAMFLAAGHFAVSRAQNIAAEGATSQDSGVTDNVDDAASDEQLPDPRAKSVIRRLNPAARRGSRGPPAAPADSSRKSLASATDDNAPVQPSKRKARGKLWPDFVTADDADSSKSILISRDTGDEQPSALFAGFADASTENAADDDLRKQVELQQQQIGVLERMVKLTAEELQKRGPSTGELESRLETLESRSRQAAERDRQLADGLDNLNDHLDAAWRYGPKLPSQLKEWFLPGGTNETPLAIYGSVVQNYRQLNAQAGQFDAGTISPYFLLQLNNRFLLESVVDLGAAGTVGISQIQMDYIVSDAVTVVIGRYLTPIGFYHERLDHEWINKLTDAPMMFSQVSPLLSTNGVQVRGSRYIFGSPVKLEYSFYGGNSATLGTAPNTPPNQQIDDLAAITSAPGIVNALGSRLGLWIPELGLNFGMSGYSQGAYTPAANDRFHLYGFDASYHRGNWDARFEFAQTNQQAGSYLGNDIVRTGLYTQLAYRDYQNSYPILASLELVGRFSMVRFSGIDPTLIDPTAFGPGAAPVDQNQYNAGINYYLYPSMVLKFAYEWNLPRGDIALNNNTFMSQFVWAF